LNNFRANLVAAERLNALGTSVHGVTKFSDLTETEFRSLYTGYKAGSVRAALGDIPVLKALGSAPAPPASVDWRTKNVITPVKDQGQCGSCWAFSTVEEIETDWIMAGNSMVELSPEQIVDCDTVDQGCNGGDTVTAYKYVEGAGLESESSYPYTSGLASVFTGSGSGSGSNPSSTCSYNAADVVVNITGFSYGTTGNNENLFMSNVATIGPMSVCLATGGWQTYTSGILTAATCGTQVDHCVQVVGYNTASSAGKYWIVRNSWNTDWGIQGYIYVQLGTNACDIAGEVTYVHTKKP